MSIIRARAEVGGCLKTIFPRHARLEAPAPLWAVNAGMGPELSLGGGRESWCFCFVDWRIGWWVGRLVGRSVG